MFSEENSNHKYLICRRCLNKFFDNDKIKKQKKLDEHLKECGKYDEIKTILPTEEEKIIKFKNYKNQIKSPFILVADFESLLKKLDVKN